MPTEASIRDEEAEVYAWRADGLTDLGIDRGLALEYAHEVDYHDVQTMIDKTGWTARQCFELLRP